MPRTARAIDTNLLQDQNLLRPAIAAVPKIIAAIDLGSNSFHLIIASWDQHRLQVLARMRETVRLGSGLDNDNNLNPQIIKKALQCVRKFAQALSEYEVAQLRVIGTHTLRVANNAQQFTEAARDALQAPITVVSGVQEAELIYFGVANAATNSSNPKLVLDIGGGSTEIIYGVGTEAKICESLSMGCVSLQQRFFASGAVTATAYEAAKQFAIDMLEKVRDKFKFEWQHVIGTSGTIQSVRDIALANAWGGAEINLALLQHLKQELLSLDNVAAISFKGIRRDRKAILPSGLAILEALFEQFNLLEMQVSDNALREGVLCSIIQEL